MKKLTLVVSLILLIVGAEVYACPPPPSPPHAGCRYNNARVSFHYSNTVPARPHINPVNRRIINNSPPVHIMPPPPPPRYSVRYEDDKKFHARSYYIPSYCMPETGFYNNTFNPFCSHYRPYGSNVYISFQICLNKPSKFIMLFKIDIICLLDKKRFYFGTEIHSIDRLRLLFCIL